jgi:hypothetical protein
MNATRRRNGRPDFDDAGTTPVPFDVAEDPWYHIRNLKRDLNSVLRDVDEMDTKCSMDKRELFEKLGKLGDALKDFERKFDKDHETLAKIEGKATEMYELFQASKTLTRVGLGVAGVITAASAVVAVVARHG